jgi:hypothetical protein
MRSRKSRPESHVLTASLKEVIDHQQQRVGDCYQTPFAAAPPHQVLAVKSDLPPQLRPRVFGVELGQFSQQLFRLLVVRHGDGDLHLDDLVSAHTVFRG